MRPRAACLIAWSIPASIAAADVQVISDEAAFRRAFVATTTVSFNSFPVGFFPATTLTLGAVTVVLTGVGSAPIFAPALGFTTNFLSTPVKDGVSGAVVHFPAGTLGGGMLLVSIPITVTARSPTGESATVNFSSASAVQFLGFVSSTGLDTVTFSSPAATPGTPIVNIGNITYGAVLAPQAVDIPTVGSVARGILGAALVLSALAILWRRSGV